MASSNTETWSPTLNILLLLFLIFAWSFSTQTHHPEHKNSDGNYDDIDVFIGFALLVKKR